MCGLLTIIAPPGNTTNIDDRGAESIRDRMAHRGPDAEGLWRSPDDRVVMAHRRLSILDPRPDADQPFLIRDDQGNVTHALVYNGELYNDRPIRTELEKLGVRFRTDCDTETLLHSLKHWGASTPSLLRGMYSFAFFDFTNKTVICARDPLGIKPLYWAQAGDGSLVFASEIHAITAHPSVRAAPDLPMVSMYLSTIRTVVGERTMYEGIQAVPPGGVMQISLGEKTHQLQSATLEGGGVTDTSIGLEAAIAQTRSVLEESIAMHMRSDVPICALLSGGLDSTITTFIAKRSHPDLRTYCAGDPSPLEGEVGYEGTGDLDLARLASASLGTNHAEALLNADLFRERWRWMIRRMRMPLSTPNEVAIYEVSRRLREDNCIVTLSGEGADELYLGYEGALRSVWSYIHEKVDNQYPPGAFALLSSSWVQPGLKAQLFNEDAWKQLDDDAFVFDAYDKQFAQAAEGEQDLFAAFGKLLRRINLTGLLQRLDSATMLAGVEGRTPYADTGVAALAESIPAGHRFWINEEDQAHTKMPLRRAFADDLPREIVDRPKASFPVPFQRWCASEASTLLESEFLRSYFQPGSLAIVAAEPERHWNLAWPLINLSLWGEEVFGN